MIFLPNSKFDIQPTKKKEDTPQEPPKTTNEKIEGKGLNELIEKVKGLKVKRNNDKPAEKIHFEI